MTCSRWAGGVVAAIAIAAAVVVALGLGLGPGVAGVAIAQPTPAPPPAEVDAGRALFEVACTTCHGPDGRGTAQGPSLVGVGAASADFYLSTGRMPLDRNRVQAERKRPAYSADDIARLTAYVASLGPGPPIPVVNLAGGDLPLGYRLYADNCASCHSSAGAGGALGHAVYAPPLNRASAREVAAAVRIGPGSMPRFGAETLDDHEVDSVVRYVLYLRNPRDAGGFDLGHLGPLSEGLVAWAVGLLGVLAAARWIGTRD
ncbi:MAG TPA: c-type cytochrome [Acidimicrobiales bacterium]|nr:c-type cytochrome [Acidimicrobiales bacterium]